MHKMLKLLMPGTNFEYRNRRIRRLIHRQVQALMIPLIEDQHFHPCIRELEKIHCCNDMNYMLLIMKSSRKNKLEYMLKCIKNREQRKQQRQIERIWGFHHP